LGNRNFLEQTVKEVGCLLHTNLQWGDDLIVDDYQWK